MADIGPAVFIGVLTGRRDVLHVDGADALAVAFDPGEGIGLASDDPGDIGFPVELGAAGKDLFLRGRTIRQCRKFEVVIVPAEDETGIAQRLAGGLQALTLAYCLLPCVLKAGAAVLLTTQWIRHPEGR